MRSTTYFPFLHIFEINRFREIFSCGFCILLSIWLAESVHPPISNISSIIDQIALEEGRATRSGLLRDGYKDFSVKRPGESDRLNTRLKKKMKAEEEDKLVSIIKEIEAIDEMKCFAKVLCGLNIVSSPSSADIRSVASSYIHLMRSIKLEDDSSEETRPTSDKTKDAVSQFLVKSGSGLLKNKKKDEQIESHIASSSQERDDDEPDKKELTHRLSIRKKNERIKSPLKKPRLGTRTNKKDDDLVKLAPLLSSSRKPLGENEEETLTSQIASWLPQIITLSFGKDSFETDPFFKETPSSLSNKRREKWQQNLDDLVKIIKGTDDDDNNGRKKRRERRRNFRDLSLLGKEAKVYSTAIEIGKKLKNTRQCDYIYSGCPVLYSDMIKIITTIRQDLTQNEEATKKPDKNPTSTTTTTTTERPTQPKNKNKESQPTPPVLRNQPSIIKGKGEEVKNGMEIRLPNGMEIKVHMSSAKQEKDKDEEVKYESPHGDSYVREEEEDDDDNRNNASDDEGTEALNQEDPAISASYELDDEQLDAGDDFRKPLPIDIFKKVSMNKKAGSNHKNVNNRVSATTKKTPTISKSTLITASRPKPSRKTTKISKSNRTTKRPSGKMTTTKQLSSLKPAGTSAIPMKKVMKPQENSVHLNSSSTSPSKHKPQTVPVEDDENDSDSSEKDGFIGIKTSNNKTPNNNSSSSTSNLKTSKKTPKPVYNLTKNNAAKTRQQSSTTTEKPKSPVKIRKKSGSRITIEIDNSESESHSYEEDNGNYEVTAVSTTTPTPGTTLPALAMFTKSYMDQVIYDMYKTRETTTPNPPDLNKMFLLPQQKRKSTTTGKPAWIFTSKNKMKNGTGFHDASFESSGSVEVGLKPSRNPGHDTSLEIETKGEREDDQEFHPVVSHSEEPEQERPSGKKRIKYKNPKRPYLVLMKTQSTSSPSRKRPKPKPPSSWEDMSMPLVIEEGTDPHHWTPLQTQRNQ